MLWCDNTNLPALRVQDGCELFTICTFKRSFKSGSEPKNLAENTRSKILPKWAILSVKFGSPDSPLQPVHGKCKQILSLYDIVESVSHGDKYYC